MKDKNLVWLASYPKSGNTWFRAFLTSLVTGNQELKINQLAFNDNLADNHFFEFATGLDISEMSQAEIDDLKPEVMKYLALTSSSFTAAKIHEKFRLLSNEKPLIPILESLVVIYIIRNPLDVAVSYAHHDQLSIDRVIERMNEDYTLASLGNREFFNIPETLGTWSEHVVSWVSNGHIPVHVVRYEDMKREALNTFTKAVEAMGLKYSEEKISAAIKNSSFERLQAQEKESFFKEKTAVSNSFFRSGKIGDWKTKLNDNQVEKIIRDHKKVMIHYNYLDLNHNPI